MKTSNVKKLPSEFQFRQCITENGRKLEAIITGNLTANYIHPK
jgi:hypothetical protein